VTEIVAAIPVGGVVLLATLALFVVCATFVHFRGRVRHAFGRQLTDHSTFVAPYNLLMYAASAVPNRPFLDVRAFPDLAPLVENWQVIRDEAHAARERGAVQVADGNTDLAFHSFFRRGWKRFYLKWYDGFLPSARAQCPKTVALLEQIPSVHAAIFASMGPGGHLQKHRDPFAGSLRLHLGLATPNDPACRIYVDGETYHWKDGEAVLFDETYIHWVHNETDQERMILFCDVERPLKSRLLTRFNRFVIRHFVKATTTRNYPGEKVGLLNRVFQALYSVRLPIKRLRKSHKTLYYVCKYVLLAGALLLAFRLTGVI
jgi:beta-hydroxylase